MGFRFRGCGLESGFRVQRKIHTVLGSAALVKVAVRIRVRVPSELGAYIYIDL